MSETPPAQPEPKMTGARARERLAVVIFGTSTPAGRAFDVVLLLIIVASVLAVMLESVAPVSAEHGTALRAAEWVFTALFTIEYLLRLASVPQPLRYARSFFGIVDLLSILPSFLSLIYPGAQSMLVIRALRLLRIFRVFKLARFLGEAAFVPGRLEADRLVTAIGHAPAPRDCTGERVDVLVRPDDLSLQAAADGNGGNGHIAWARYEGETRLYGIGLDHGETLRVRTNHEHDYARGTRVAARICAEHPLAAFPPAD